MAFTPGEDYDPKKDTRFAKRQGAPLMAVTTQQLTSNVLGLLGAIVGGVLGYYTFSWIFDHGFYGMMIPGAFLGLGCGLLARHPSQLRGALCGVAALALGLYTEWRFFPFRDDQSLAYFLRHVPDLSPVTLVMIAAGAFFAYWLGRDAGLSLMPGRRGPSALQKQVDSPPTA
jgi:hypothetical protein